MHKNPLHPTVDSTVERKSKETIGTKSFIISFSIPLSPWRSSLDRGTGDYAVVFVAWSVNRS